jgi:itaconate CoA-transferase
VHAIITFLK